MCTPPRHVFTAALVMLFCWLAPVPSPATEDFPGEAKGYSSTSYDLSADESVNLANGNLTFRVPLSTIATDGGLAYDIALHFNSKLFAHRHVMCWRPDVSTITTSVSIGDGVANYGFGWDLRPPRLQMDAECVNRDLGDGGCAEGPSLERPLAWVDPSGAKHYLYNAQAWDSPGQGPDWRDYLCVLSEGETCYTWDGSNLRVRPIWGPDPEDEQSWILLGADVEDGAGTVYRHRRRLEPALNNNYRKAVGVVDIDHFEDDLSGLFLTEIVRGPWDGGHPANRLVFEYCEDDEPDCGGLAFRPWLLRRIKAIGPTGSVERKVSFTYLPDPGHNPTTPLLRTVSIPTMAPSLNGDGEASADITLRYGTWSPSESESPPPHCAEQFGVTDAPFLAEVSYPDGTSYRFGSEVADSPNLPAELHQALAGSWFAAQVPTGAMIGYEMFPYFTGMINSRRLPEEAPPPPQRETEPVLAECGTGTAPKTLGVVGRREIVRDAAAERVVETRFTQKAVCGGFREPDPSQSWPYPFDYAFGEDQIGQHDVYLITGVERWADAPGSDPAYRAEVHRFHPSTYLEFSVDYLEARPGAVPPADGCFYNLT